MTITYYPSLTPFNADSVFPTTEDGKIILDALEWAAIAEMTSEALGFEKIDPKDIALRVYDMDDAYGILAVEERYLIGTHLMLCAVATIGDREVVFTCDC